MTLLEQAVDIAGTTGDIEPAVKARSALARARRQLGDPAAALAAAAAGRELSYPVEGPAMRLMEGVALLELHRTDEGAQTLNDALTAAHELLALADTNVAALQARALTLAGLAGPCPGHRGVQAFAQAQTITRAAGVAAETNRLLDVIVSQDRSGVLAEVRSAQVL